ncbi:MAG: DUF4097 family beta strand repeat-containing protein [Candidatus Zixiibacteriota bacterium]
MPLWQRAATTSALVLISVAAAVADEFAFDFQKSLETPDKVSVSILSLEGDLEITTHDEPEVLITATKRIEASTKELASEIAGRLEIRVVQSNDKVTIETVMGTMTREERSLLARLLGGSHEVVARIDFNITVPVHCDLSIASQSGTISADQVRGPVSVKASSAHIVLNGIEGAVDVDNGSGSTTGELLFGPVTVRQAAGTVSLQWVEGDIRVKAGSADVDVVQERGALEVVTASGSINIKTNLDSSRDYYVQTESGNINLLLPETSSGKLHIGSEAGQIRTDIPVTLKSLSKKQMVGEFGSGGVSITLMSRLGDVSVDQF